MYNGPLVCGINVLIVNLWCTAIRWWCGLKADRNCENPLTAVFQWRTMKRRIARTRTVWWWEMGCVGVRRKTSWQTLSTTSTFYLTHNTSRDESRIFPRLDIPPAISPPEQFPSTPPLRRVSTPLKRQFQNWHYPILLTLTNSPCGVLTLLDPRHDPNPIPYRPTGRGIF